MSKKYWSLAFAIILVLNMMVVVPVMASPSEPGSFTRGDDMIDIGPELRAREGKDVAELNAMIEAAGISPSDFTVRASSTYTVGDKLMWWGLDEVDPIGHTFWNGVFETEYEVRAIREYCEVWVQTDLNYYNADGTINRLHPDAKDPMYVTQERIDYLADACSDHIRPTDVKYFGAYDDRDGSNGWQATFNAIFGTHLSEFVGGPQHIVVLVSNVRDDNFYDPLNNGSFIAGFNWGTMNTYGDRNFVTIDSKQWNDRVGNSGHPTRAYGFDSTIAHELQHMIHRDHDGNEETWLNEGMSGFAEFINGYWLTESLGDRTQWQNWPENSLILWGDQDHDQGGIETLADYQLTNSFFLYLTGRNNGVYTDTASLTASTSQGILSVNEMLAASGSGLTFAEIFRDFRRDMLYGGYTNDAQPTANWNADFIDAYVGHVEAVGGPGTSQAYLGELRDNLDSQGYSTEGVPPFGTDFMELGWSQAIADNPWELEFEGDITPPATAWLPVTATDVLTPSGAVAGDVLYSGHTDITDNFVIFGPFTPAEGDVLSFDHLYNIEDEWDYGFVQVTTDTTGATGWTSLDITGMMTETDTGAHQIIKDSVPGYSGFSGGWVTATYTMDAAYAGRPVLLAFRYATDWGTGGSDDALPAGWFIDNVEIGDTVLTDGSVPGMSIHEARNAGPKFDFEFLTWEDGDAENVANLYTVTSPEMSISWVGPKMRVKFDLQPLAAGGDAGFDEAGERGVIMVSSYVDIFSDLINGGMMAKYADYTLKNMPPSILTSDVRFDEYESGQLYAGETFTVGVYLDNFGYSPENVAASGPAHALFGLEIPADTEYVTDSATLGAAYAADLSTVAATFPAVPGIYWESDVATRTESIQAAFTADPELVDGDTVTATVHFASDNTAAPEQHFMESIDEDVTSSFGLTSAAPKSEYNMPKSIVQIIAAVVNGTGMPRAMQLVADIPEDTTFQGVTSEIAGFGRAPLGAPTVVTGTDAVTITQVITQHSLTNGTNITFDWLLGDSYDFGDVMTSTMQLTDLTTNEVFNLVAVAKVEAQYRIYLPLIMREQPNTVILP